MNQIENHCFPPDATDAMLHSRIGQPALPLRNVTGPIGQDVSELFSSAPSPMRKRPGRKGWLHQEADEPKDPKEITERNGIETIVCPNQDGIGLRVPGVPGLSWGGPVRTLSACHCTKQPLNHGSSPPSGWRASRQGRGSACPGLDGLLAKRHLCGRGKRDLIHRHQKPNYRARNTGSGR